MLHFSGNCNHRCLRLVILRIWVVTCSRTLIIGIKPAVLAIIAGAFLKLGKKALKSIALGIFGSGVLIASIMGVNEILALLIAGLLGAVFFYFKSKSSNGLKSISPLVLLAPYIIASKYHVYKCILNLFKGRCCSLWKRLCTLYLP